MAVSPPASTDVPHLHDSGIRNEPSSPFSSAHRRRNSSSSFERGNGLSPVLTHESEPRNRSTPVLNARSETKHERHQQEQHDSAQESPTRRTNSSIDLELEQSSPQTTIAVESSDAPRMTTRANNADGPVLVRAHSPVPHRTTSPQTNAMIEDEAAYLEELAQLPYPPRRGQKIPLPPIDAYSFDSILKAGDVQPELDATINAIAGLCETYQTNLGMEVQYLINGQEDLDERVNEVEGFSTDVLNQTNGREHILGEAAAESQRLVGVLLQEAEYADRKLSNILSMLVEMGQILPAADGNGDLSEEYPRLGPLIRSKSESNASSAEHDEAPDASLSSQSPSLVPSSWSSSLALERTNTDIDPPSEEEPTSPRYFVSRPLMPSLTLDGEPPRLPGGESELLQMPRLNANGVPITIRNRPSEETITRVTTGKDDHVSSRNDLRQEAEDNLTPLASSPTAAPFFRASAHKRPLSLSSILPSFHFLSPSDSPPLSSASIPSGISPPPSITLSHTPSFTIQEQDEGLEREDNARHENISAEARLRRLLNADKRRSRRLWDFGGIFARRRSPSVDASKSSVGVEPGFGIENRL
jgi:hypothetical protein